MSKLSLFGLVIYDLISPLGPARVISSKIVATMNGDGDNQQNVVVSLPNGKLMATASRPQSIPFVRSLGSFSSIMSGKSFSNLANPLTSALLPSNCPLNWSYLDTFTTIQKALKETRFSPTLGPEFKLMLAATAPNFTRFTILPFHDFSLQGDSLLHLFANKRGDVDRELHQ